MMAQKDYYRVLGLNNNASADEIKKAYRQLAMQYHPDRNHGREEWAHNKFKEINEAFSVLGDPEKRREYDDFGAVGNIGDIFGSQAARTTFEDLMKDFDGAGLEVDFLDDVFGDSLRGTGFSFRKFRRRPGGPGRTQFETRWDVNLEDLFEKAAGPIMPGVNYEIVLNKEQALRGMEKELVRNGKRLKVKIPAGVKTGNRIKLRNALETTDGRAGDIIINIKVK